MMTLQEASVEEDRWSPVEVLIWIATRSRRFMDALRGVPLSCVVGAGRASRPDSGRPVAAITGGCRLFDHRRRPDGQMRAADARVAPIRIVGARWAR